MTTAAAAGGRDGPEAGFHKKPRKTIGNGDFMGLIHDLCLQNW